MPRRQDGAGSRRNPRRAKSLETIAGMEIRRDNLYGVGADGTMPGDVPRRKLAGSEKEEQASREELAWIENAARESGVSRKGVRGRWTTSRIASLAMGIPLRSRTREGHATGRGATSAMDSERTLTAGWTSHRAAQPAVRPRTGRRHGVEMTGERAMVLPDRKREPGLVAPGLMEGHPSQKSLLAGEGGIELGPYPAVRF